MKKVLALLLLVLLTETATADIPPPPPPKGQKYVSVNNQVVLGKGVTGYVFVERVVRFSPGPQPPTFRKMKLNAEKATAMTAGARRTSVSLLAVSEDKAKEFKTDADLFAALKTNALKAPEIGFNSTTIVSDSVKGQSVEWTYTITSIDAKAIKAKVAGDGANAPTRRRGPPDVEDAPTDSATAAPRGGVWVAGLAATLGVMLGGLWLAGRSRRRA